MRELLRTKHALKKILDIFVIAQVVPFQSLLLRVLFKAFVVVFAEVVYLCPKKSWKANKLALTGGQTQVNVIL